jgi:hypothetical protein
VVNEAHAAQVRELELFTVDYFAPPVRRVRVLRPIDDKKIMDTIAFQGNPRDVLDAIWQAVGRPTVAKGYIDTAARHLDWRGLETNDKIKLVREFIRDLETVA